jgi:microcystin-dependent protein
MEGLVGEIRAFAGNYAPVNWLICGGYLLPIIEEEYQQLFSLIGTTYGGDGRTTFRIPDLRSKMAIGQGQGPRLTDRQLGEGSGVSDVTLTTENLPAHNHLVRTSSATSGNVEEPSSSTALGILESSEGTAFGYLKSSASGAIERDLNEKTVQDTGNGYSHNNMMPCIAINYIICYKGIYPQRS